MNEERNDVIDFFLIEANEHLEFINDGLLTLEKHQDDLDLVDKIFRAVHGIKGSAGMLGFSTISQLAHRIEDLLANMRDRKLDVSEPMIDFLFQSLDILTHQIENIPSERPEDKAPLRKFDILYAEFAGLLEPDNRQTIPPQKSPSLPLDVIPSSTTEPSKIALAEMYISRDLFGRAMAIYRGILRTDPSNTTIRQRLEETLALQAYIDDISRE
jgi:chemotaxis protein histidine kinase CheA